MERHGHMRGLASRRPMDFGGAVDTSNLELVQHKPCVNSRIQAHTEESGVLAARVCFRLIHRRGTFSTKAGRGGGSPLRGRWLRRRRGSTPFLGVGRGAGWGKGGVLV